MLILAKLEGGIGAAVILNGVTIYHEDDDKGYSNNGFDCEMVASRLHEATKLPVTTVDVTRYEAGGDEWNFDTVNEVAVDKYNAKLFIQIPVDLKAEKLVDGSLNWSTPWDAAEQAAAVCYAQNVDAEAGHGKAFAVYINGVAANGANKDHKRIVKAVIGDVQRRIDVKPIKLTADDADAAAEALGREVGPDEVRNALDFYRGRTLADVRKVLKSNEEQFRRQGGRGVNLADEIDRLRLYIAVQEKRGAK